MRTKKLKLIFSFLFIHFEIKSPYVIAESSLSIVHVLMNIVLEQGTAVRQKTGILYVHLPIKMRGRLPRSFTAIVKSMIFQFYS